MLECMLTVCLYVSVVKHYCGWFVLMSLGFLVLVRAGFVWNEDVRVVIGWICGVVGGDDCGWWCGVRLLCMGVWLERCRDGSYTR